MAIFANSASFLLAATILALLGAPGSAVFSGSVLTSGNQLNANESLVQGSYTFIMQSDCNLVLYSNQTVLWASNTQGSGSNCSLVLQSDGELLVLSGTSAVLWRSETAGEHGRCALVLQPNGDVVVYGGPVWSTGTTNIAPPGL